MSGLSIGGRRIAADVSPLVIAEAGVNHNGDLRIARALVDAAADAGADSVKFQTFRASAVTIGAAPPVAYQHERVQARTQREMLEALELPSSAMRELQGRARERGILFLSTPFDLDSLKELVALNVPALKISSGDLTNLILLRAALQSGKPMLLSTGMATLEEVDRIMEEVSGAPIALLHCTSAYPTLFQDANLKAIATLRDRFGVEVGFSDHTAGISAAIAATALGATIVEKHLTLDRKMLGPDHAASLEPTEFASMVRGIREAHSALGDGTKAPRAVEADTLRAARRSLVTSRALPVGHRLTAGDLDAKRPGTGISPLDLDRLVGMIVKRPLMADHILDYDDVQASDDGQSLRT